jgi:hypothetical protein
MEYLVPVLIVAVGIGLFLVFRRRTTVVQPPTNAGGSKTDPPAPARRTDPMEEILNELNADMAVGGTKRVTILKGNKQIGWTVTKKTKDMVFSPEDLRSLVIKGSSDRAVGDLLAKLMPGSLASNAPPEARLQYPGSSLVVDSFESQRTSGGIAESRDVYKTTLATEADGAAVLAWYRDWLLSNRWQLSPSIGTNADSSQDYVRGSEHFRVAVADPATLAPVLAVPIPATAKTVYEVEYSNASTPPPTS